MNKYRQVCKKTLQKIIEQETDIKVSLDEIIVESPPRLEMGDLAFPMFPYARIFKRSPADIAELIGMRLKSDISNEGISRIETKGPYLNVFLDHTWLTEKVLNNIEQSTKAYGRGNSLAGKRIMVEFSCPNTNKPLHLGHLRNDAIGMSIARILEENGAEILKANLINDRGIHICKSMLSYLKFGENETPESRGIKGDYLVGEFYIRFDEWAKENPEAEKQAGEMLKKWEHGDSELIELWKKMNRWAIDGIEETYRKTGVTFDRTYYESETYLLGRDETLKGLEQGIFYQEEDGSIWVDLTDFDLDKKVLQRSDGTSLYLTQDIGTAVQRHRDWPFDRLIYVVASEQRYHFHVLFKVLNLLGYKWSDQLHHLAYGMVNLPEGKMKSREGITVDADDLIDTLENLAAAEISEKQRESEIGEIREIEQTSRDIALGALNYYLLQSSPYKDMIFNPRESISFTGNTGPYLQYTGARISSMLRKYEERKTNFKNGAFKPELLNLEAEWEIIKLLASYPDSVALAARDINPSVITGHLYDIAKAYSRYYHDHPVLHNKDQNLVVSRIKLAQAVRRVLWNGLLLIGVPALEIM